MLNTNKIKIGFLMFFVLFSIMFFKFYPASSNELSFPVEMSKDEALIKSSVLVEENNWNVKDYKKTSLFFIDKKAQAYYELEIGNYSSLSKIIKQEKSFIPALWKVRYIPKTGSNDLALYFTPKGNPYGFYRKISDLSSYENMSETDAKLLAENSCNSWNVDIHNYTLMDTSKETMNNGRIDFTFNYENKQNIFGSAKDKLSLKVCGNQISKIEHYLSIPESFSRKYEEKRTFNDTISLVANIAFFIILLIIGFFCFLYLNKNKLILWKKAALFSILLFVLLFLNNITHLNHDLIYINIHSQKLSSFYIVTILNYVLESGGISVLTFISIVIGEGLFRKAFPEKVQFWKSFTKKNIGSKELLTSVVVGYVFFISMLIYESIFYDVVGNLPGWWSPSSMTIDPNLENDLFAWFTSFPTALEAGVFEEFAFRAIPISLGVLIGNKYNKRKFFITLSFIFQMLIFSAAHANYTGFPPYARVLELLLVALCFGLVFYYLGLIPVIIAHFIYDLTLMSWNIISTYDNALIPSKIIIMLILFSPIIYIVYGRLKYRKTANTNDFILNKHWEHIMNEGITVNDTRLDYQQDSLKPPLSKNKKLILSLLICSISITVLIYKFGSIKKYVTPININKYKAELIAKEELSKLGFVYNNDWKLITKLSISPEYKCKNFLEKEGILSYKKVLNKYLKPYSWFVRFVKTKGNANEKAEEFKIWITDENSKTDIHHIIPENALGKSTSKNEALSILYNLLSNNYKMDISSISIVSWNEKKLENRTDWIFNLQDKSLNMNIYTANINAVVSGNKVSSIMRTVELPKEEDENVIKTISSDLISNTFISIPFFILVFSLIVISIINKSKKKLCKSAFFKFFIIILVLEIISIIVNTPIKAINFSSAKPFNIQLTSYYLVSLLKITISSYLLATIVGYAYFYKNTLESKIDYVDILFSISIGIIIFAFITIFIKNPIIYLDSYAYYGCSSANTLIGNISNLSISYLKFLVVFFGLATFLNNFKESKLKNFLKILSFSILSSTLIPLNYNLKDKLVLFIILGLTLTFTYEKIYKYNVLLSSITTSVVFIGFSIKKIVLGEIPIENISLLISVAFVFLINLYILFNKKNVMP